MTSKIDEVARETAKLVGPIDPQEPVIDSAPPPGTALPMADTPELRAAIEATPAHLLIGVYGLLSGDIIFLEQFRAHIKSVWVGGPAIPEELQRELRDRLLTCLTGPQPAQFPPVTKKTMTSIMSVMVAEPIADEFIPLVVDQMNFTPAGRFRPVKHAAPPADFRVAVIGAGLSGIAAAIEFSRAGYDYKVFEKAEDVGGVWWSNRYPGVGVDTPSHFYSYSFELNPDWPRFYSDGPVMMKYWRHVVEKFGIRDRICFQTEVVSCTWSEDDKRWTVLVRRPDGSEQSHTFDAVVCASGLFSQPQNPKVPGLQRFKGKVVHTARWDTTIDLKNKSVVQIGTGASGVQVGPEISPIVSKLTVFQRTPPWVRIAPDAASGQTSEGFRWALKHVPHLAQWMRFYTYWNASDGAHPFVRWDKSYQGSNLAFNELGERIGKIMLAGMRAKLAKRPDLLDKVMPNYPLFGKRPLHGGNWLDMLMRDNVELVPQAVAEIDESGVVAQDGTHYPADVIILATGFAVTKMLRSLQINGRGGVRLADVWGDDDPRAYNGTFVPDFPNLFIMHGPNIGATHGAGANIYMEAQADYILHCLSLMFERGSKSIEVEPQAFEAFNARVAAACDETIWAHPKVNSYYLNSKRRNFVSWPWRIVDFWEAMKRPRAEDFAFER